MKFTMAHSSIAVKDVERSVEFYKKAVGLKVKSVKDLPHINLTYMVDEEESGYELEITLKKDHEGNYKVTLSTYNIGETEVTRMLWYAVMGTDPSEFKGDLSRPVEMVSWNDCQTFITKLNKLTGKHFRLPTEAEWTFAARGGNLSHGYLYAGSDVVGNVAWYEGNSSATQPVATKAPNELGIYDMSGNVWEWCQDWYGDFPTGNHTNPQGPSTGTARVFKGGSWHSPANNCTIGTRSHTAPENQVNHRGLRLVL